MSFWLALERLIDTYSPVSAIVWDVDGTLGPLPGWQGDGHVWHYTVRPQTIRNALHMLKSKGIASIVASRNGMFCEIDSSRPSPSTYRQFLDMGFTIVGGCYRTEPDTSKVEAPINMFGQSGNVILFDDQVEECRRAAQQGAVGVCLNDVIARSLPANNYRVYIPGVAPAPPPLKLVRKVPNPVPRFTSHLRIPFAPPPAQCHAPQSPQRRRASGKRINTSGLRLKPLHTGDVGSWMQ